MGLWAEAAFSAPARAGGREIDWTCRSSSAERAVRSAFLDLRRCEFWNWFRRQNVPKLRRGHNGEWTDLPMGASSGCGRLSLFVRGDGVLLGIDATGGFGASEWIRG
jgi:hypothetical protein